MTGMLKPICRVGVDKPKLADAHRVVGPLHCAARLGSKIVVVTSHRWLRGWVI